MKEAGLLKVFISTVAHIFQPCFPGLSIHNSSLSSKTKQQFDEFLPGETFTAVEEKLSLRALEKLYVTGRIFLIFTNTVEGEGTRTTILLPQNEP